jgi:hypothetical protein
MSNPWETSNPWGKGSKEWNRWMVPEAESNALPTSALTPDGTSPAFPPIEGQRKATQAQKDEAQSHNDWYRAHLIDFFAFAPGRKPFFKMVDLNQLHLSIRKRVDDPNEIDQGFSNLCGIAATMQIFAEFEPKAYVDVIWQLYEMGKATTRNYTINSYWILGENPPSKSLPDADYILLSSIRTSENAFLNYNPSNDEGLSGMTFPNEIARIIVGTTQLKDVTNNALRLCGWSYTDIPTSPVAFPWASEKFTISSIWSLSFKDRDLSDYFRLFEVINKYISNGAKVILLYDTVIDEPYGSISQYWHYVQIRFARIDRYRNVEITVWDYGKTESFNRINSNLERFINLHKRIWVFN